ncbi:hypothetical protein VP01_2096g1, partial [Puccinia sorghi]
RGLQDHNNDLYSFGQTANFIATSIHVPCVRKGVAYLKGEMGLGDKHLDILLWAGLLRDLYPDSSTAVGEKVELYVETAHGNQDITHWVNGYGHILHFYPRSGEHGYVAISAYLKEVAPQIETRLHKEAEQSEVDSPLPVSNTGTPMIRPNESSLEGTTCPYTSNRPRPNGIPRPTPSGIVTEGGFYQVKILCGRRWG